MRAVVQFANGIIRKPFIVDTKKLKYIRHPLGTFCYYGKDWVTKPTTLKDAQKKIKEYDNLGIEMPIARAFYGETIKLLMEKRIK